jgi:multimeric flavodoxin WrbA
VTNKEAIMILGVSGSPRKNGNSDVMLRRALEAAASAGAEVRAVYLRDYAFAPCSGCERCRKDKACSGLLDGMQLLYPLVERAEGLILASPAHHYNVSALMKAFIDRLYCYYEFDQSMRPGPWSSRLAGQGRRAVLLAVCEQRTKEDGLGFTLEAMQLPLEALGYAILLQEASFGVFAKGAVKDDADALERCARAGALLAS